MSLQVLRDYLIYHKVWLRSDKNWKKSTLKFLLKWSHFNKTIKHRNNMKNQKLKKKWSRDMVNRELSTNLAWIHVAVSEKPELTDGGRTTEAGATAVALLTPLC